MVLRLLRLPEKVVGRAVLEGVERAVDSRWHLAQKRAAQTTGRPVPERIEEVRWTFLRELTALGAASGGVAALPGAGTGTALATSAADIGWYTMRLADLVMTVAVIHGHHDATVDERRAWVLAVLAFGSGASAGLEKAAREVGRNLGHRQIGSVSGTTLRAINKRLGATVARRYGSRRGLATFGKLMPFGLGAAIGAGGNAYGVNAATKHADHFFGDLDRRLDFRIDRKLDPA
ncbi:MAG TPA: EcsC family protein [Aquihabitans sp.]|jgi:hypothetical protein|nr:EcsC family protein [Aquihabitans sp.]